MTTASPLSSEASHRPPAWAIVLAFALVYTSWGTTYYAMRVGVYKEQLPPGLFGGVRVSLAGWLLLGYLGLRGERLRLTRSELFWTAISGVILFVAGNGLVTVAMGLVPSGVAAILVATTPLWLALLETLGPWGERLQARGWLGMLAGLGGVVLLMAPKLGDSTDPLQFLGPALIFGSALSWALGSLVVRHRRGSNSHLVSAAYQMIIGGTGLALIGLILGEGQRLPEQLTPRACVAFFYLLIIGSLVGFVSFNWLLGHVQASLVGTYAYVNPVIAVLVGWLLDREELSGWILAGMVVILAGVALVRGGVATGNTETTTPQRVPAGGLTGFWQSYTAGRKNRENDPTYKKEN